MTCTCTSAAPISDHGSHGITIMRQCHNTWRNAVLRSAGIIGVYWLDAPLYSPRHPNASCHARCWTAQRAVSAATNVEIAFGQQRDMRQTCTRHKFSANTNHAKDGCSHLLLGLALPSLKSGRCDICLICIFVRGVRFGEKPSACLRRTWGEAIWMFFVESLNGELDCLAAS